MCSSDLAVILGIQLMSLNNLKAIDITYNEFLDKVENKEIAEIQIDFKNDEKFTVIANDGDTKYKTDNPKYDNFKLDMLEKDIHKCFIFSSSYLF